jgi:hypothetical protein
MVFAVAELGGFDDRVKKCSMNPDAVFVSTAPCCQPAPRRIKNHLLARFVVQNRFAIQKSIDLPRRGGIPHALEPV